MYMFLMCWLTIFGSVYGQLYMGNPLASPPTVLKYGREKRFCIKLKFSLRERVNGLLWRKDAVELPVIYGKMVEIGQPSLTSMYPFSQLVHLFSFCTNFPFPAADRSGSNLEGGGTDAELIERGHHLNLQTISISKTLVLEHGDLTWKTF